MKKKKRLLFTISVTVLVLVSIYGLWNFANKKRIENKNDNSLVEYKLTNSDENIDMTIKEDRAYNYSYVPHSNEGVGISLVTNNNKDIVTTTGIEVKKGSNFTSTIAITNLSEEQKEYMLVPIVDYKQKHIQLGKEKTNKLTFSVQSKGVTFVPFSIENMEEGIHDVIFLVMKNPNRKDLDVESRKATELNHVISIRNVAIVGDAKKKMKKIEYTKMSDTEQNSPLEGSIVTKTRELRPWVIEANLTKDINYYINVGNQQDSEQDFAIMAFLNGEQIPIRDNKDVIIGTLPADTMSRIKGTLNKENVSNGVSNFTTIYIPNPYPEFGDEFESYVEPTINVGIQK
ncbi:hypothetical protein OCA08_21675 [Bacillus cereus]|nr:hypothetical protein [Bacillus cereus]